MMMRNKCPIFSSQLSSSRKDHTYTSTTQKQEQLTPVIGQESFWSSNDRHFKRKMRKSNNKNQRAIQNKVMTGWQMNREREKKRKKKQLL